MVIRYIKSDFFEVITIEFCSVNLLIWYKKTGWIKYTMLEELAIKFKILLNSLFAGWYCIKKVKEATMKEVQ